LVVEVPKIVASNENGLLRSAAVRVWPTAGKLDAQRGLQIVERVADPDPLVAEAALRVLRGFFEEPPLTGEAMRQIVTAATTAVAEAVKRPEPNVREYAMPLLGHLQKQEALPALALALQKDEAPSVRAAAAQSLARTKLYDARMLDPLVAAQADAAPEVRAVALRLLAGLAKKDDVPPPFRAAITEKLAALGDAPLTDPDAAVRAVAYAALAESLKDKATKTLAEATQSEKDPEARRGAVIGLFMTGERDMNTVTALVDALGDADPGVSAAANRAARKRLGGDDIDEGVRAAVVRRLQTFAADKDAALRARALPVLAMAAGEAARPALLSAVRTDPDAAVRKAGMEALNAVAYREALRQAKAAGKAQAAKTPPKPPRDAEAVDAIVLALKDETALVRETAYKLFRTWSGQQLPFHPTGKPEMRERELAAIEKWWAENRADFAATKE
ncbi:MAG: hypothetical protein FJ272_08340, partial [Planctomycetes bacterium]|nr:hypothetical protein [Planctomycetota bacterium]